MALTRRAFLQSLPVCTGLAFACRAPQPHGVRASHGKELAATPKPYAEARAILVFMPETKQTQEVWNGLTDELSQDYRLVAIRVDRSDDSAIIADAIRRHQPAGVILMNNPTVAAYRDYQQNTPKLSFPPAVVVMSSFFEGQSGQLISATGISYEVPLITVMTNLRRLIALKSEQVGVVVRTPLRDYVAKQIRLAKREQVTVVQSEVGADPNPSEIKRAIRSLKRHTSVLWILNDDRLLTPRLISEGWLPGLDERPWLPTIVGAASLVSAEHSFGTFAVLPDHVALGAQAADLLLTLIQSADFRGSNAAPQLPLSTTTTIDLAQVKERFIMQKNALQQVDRILE